MSSLSLALAFGAGVLATLNPCGFALLPAYVSYVVGQDGGGNGQTGQQTGWARALRGGLLGVPLTLGFLLVFSVAGGVLALGGNALVHFFPWLAILVGIGLMAFGGRLLFTGRSIELPALGALATWLSRRRTLAKAGARQSTSAEAQTDGARTDGARTDGAWRTAGAFGLGYGLSSLGCTLPVFLLVVGSAATASGLLAAGAILAAYGLGMALVLIAVSMTAAALNDLLRQYVVPLLRWVQPLAALLLIAAGLYIVVFQLRGGRW